MFEEISVEELLDRFRKSFDDVLDGKTSGIEEVRERIDKQNFLSLEKYKNLGYEFFTV